MAFTISNMTSQAVGKQKRVSGTLTFDSSYPTGGLALSPSQLGLYQITDLDVRPGGADATHAYVPRWNLSTSAPKVLAFQGDNPNAAAAQLIEVPNATSLSAVSCAFDAWGA